MPLHFHKIQRSYDVCVGFALSYVFKQSAYKVDLAVDKAAKIINFLF